MVVLAAVGPVGALYTVESPVPTVDRWLAVVLWALSLLPAWEYTRRAAERRRPLPFLPMIGLLYGLYYGLRIALGSYDQHWSIRVIPQIDYTAPLWLALTGWIALLLAYYLLPRRHERGSRWGGTAHLQWEQVVSSRWAQAFMLLGLACTVLSSLVAVPVVLLGLLQFGASLYHLGVGLLIVRRVRHGLKTLEWLVLIFGVCAASALAFGSGSIYPFVKVCTTVFLATWIARGSFGPRFTLAVACAGIAVIIAKGALNTVRDITVSRAATLGSSERLGMMGEVLSERLKNEGFEAAFGNGIKATSQRSANLELLSNVIRRTPADVPFWGGASYLSLVGVAVPRFLWPEKPKKELGQAFGHRYGYLSARDTVTSFNLPFLVEFYANFGAWGIWAGMFMVGIIYRALDACINRPAQSELTSLVAMMLYLPLFNIESDLSLIFGGLVLNGALLWTLAYVVQAKQRTRTLRGPAGPTRTAIASVRP